MTFCVLGLVSDVPNNVAVNAVMSTGPNWVRRVIVDKQSADVDKVVSLLQGTVSGQLARMVAQEL